MWIADYVISDLQELMRITEEKMVQNPIEPVPAESVPLEGDEDDEIDLDDDEEFVLDA